MSHLPAPQASGATFAPQARFAFEGVGYVRRDVGRPASADAAPVGVKPAHDGAAKAHAMRATLANARAKQNPIGVYLTVCVGLAIGVGLFMVGVSGGLW